MSSSQPPVRQPRPGSRPVAARPYPAVGLRRQSRSDLDSEFIEAARRASLSRTANEPSAIPVVDDDGLNSTAQSFPDPSRDRGSSLELRSKTVRTNPDGAVGPLCPPGITGGNRDDSGGQLHIAATATADETSGCDKTMCIPYDVYKGPKTAVTGFVGFKARFLEHVEAIFEAYGHYVYAHPKRFMFIPVLLCLLFSTGFIFRRMELDMVRLYGLPKSEFLSALNIMQHEFPIERLQYVLAVDKSVSSDQSLDEAVTVAQDLKSANILSSERLPELYQFWQKLLWLHVPRELAPAASRPGDQRVMKKWLWDEDPLQLLYEPDFDPKRYEARRMKLRSAPDFEEKYITLDEVCMRDGFNRCKTNSIFELYASPAHWGKPFRTDEFPQYVNKKTLQAARLDSILGGMELSHSGRATTIMNATAIMFRLDLIGSEEWKTEAYAWEQGLLAMVRTMKLPTLSLFVKAERSINDELALSSLLRGEDLLMLICAAIFVTIFTVAMNSSGDPYRSKSIPAFIGVATTLLSYGGGVGLFHLLGLPHVPPSEATPFIVLAINVDDIFVLSNAYSMTYLHSRDAKTRMGLTMKDAGISVTLTTVTNIVAFAIGASTYYYAIRVFCIVTCAALVAGYLLALTVFFGALAVSARLEERYRPGPLLCSPPEESTKLVGEGKMSNTADQRSTNASVLLVYNEPEVSNYRLDANDSSNLSSRPSTARTNLSDCAGLFVVENLTNQYVIARRVAVQCRKRRSNKGLSRFPKIGGDNESFMSSCFRKAAFLAPRDAKRSSNFSSPKRNSLDSGYAAEGITTPPARDPSIEMTWLPANPGRGENSPCSYESNRAGLRLRSPSPDRRGPFSAAPSTGLPNSSSSTRHRLGAATISLYDSVPHLQPNSLDPNAVRELPKLISVGDVLVPESALRVEEPSGTVGSWARKMEMNYVGPLLTNKFVKLFIIGITMANFVWSMWMCTQVKSGIQVEDVTPFNSYLRDTLQKRGELYANYGEECIVYFQGGPKWWEPNVQEALQKLTNELSHYDHIAYVHSGLIDFLNSKYFDPEAASKYSSEAMRKAAFMEAFTKWQESARGKNYGQVFQVRNGTLDSWKFYYWLQYSTNSHDNHLWQSFVQVRINGLRESNLFNGVWTWSALGPVWESDPIIFRATMQNMIVAMVSMGGVAIFLIPDLFSSFLVLGIIVLIYTNVYGYMYLWGLNLNMLTMVNLVLAIGFAVDYTAHMTHCFNHCQGETRNRRAVEALVMMGLPVTNGMLSTYAAVIMLCLSRKYIMIVIFEMTITIIASAFWHGGIFMPVLLSCIGPLASTEVTVVELERGKISNTWVVECPSGITHSTGKDGCDNTNNDADGDGEGHGGVSLHTKERVNALRRSLEHSKLKCRPAPASLFSSP